MKSFFKLIFVLLLVAVVAGVVASIASKKKLESMSDDEIREYLGAKLAGKVGDDQLATIQDAVISGVRGKKPEVDHYIEDVDEAMDELADVAEEAAEQQAEEAEAATE
ncbi:MAG: hypothetical protein DRJ28_00250 [Actinobacteria bacterium]|nr:MAG: hypothetical protein DRJ28_00250 [Actinomycetota bacterium]